MARLMKNEWNYGRGWVASLRGDMGKYRVNSDYFDEEDFKEILKKIRSEQRKEWRESMEDKNSLGVHEFVCKKKLDKRRWNGGKMDCMVLRYWSGSFWYGMQMDLSREGRCIGCVDDFSVEHWMRGCWCTHNWRLRWPKGDWRESLVQEEAVVDLERCKEECVGGGIE